MSSDRLTGLDASFLHLEDAVSHMHVAGVMIFEARICGLVALSAVVSRKSSTAWLAARTAAVERE